MCTPLLSIKPNTSYSPTNPTGKYRPLDGQPNSVTVYPKQDDNSIATTSFDTLILHRYNFFFSISSFSDEYTSYINYYYDGTVKFDSSKPPILVISSNRSKWIADQHKKMKDYIKEKPVSSYGISSIDYLPPNGFGYEPIPLYFPERFALDAEETRRTYIFVHLSEYTTYVQDLKDTNINVIGWISPKPSFIRSKYETGLVGFGMSRAAAVNFAQNRDYRWSTVWMVDDNVCYINQRPSAKNLNDYESTFHAKDCCLSGFKEPDSNPKNPIDLPLPMTADRQTNEIAQQMVYINLSKIDTYNFAPFFVNSNEDYSLTKFLEANSKTVFLQQAKIIKGQVPTPQTGTSTVTQNLIQNMMNLWPDYEKDLNVYNQRDSSPVSQKLEKALGTEALQSSKKTCAIAVEQMFRMAIGSENKALPKIDLYKPLFQPSFKNTIIQAVSQD